MLAVMVPFLLLYWVVARKVGIGLTLASASPRDTVQPGR
jgi:hypothetical protein